MTTWLWRSPFWVRAAGGTLLMVPFVLAIPHALYAHPRDPLFGLGGAGGFLGAFLSSRYHNPKFWALSGPQRQLARRSVLTGKPSGDHEVDTVVLGLLETQARQFTANTIATAVVAIGVAAVGILAGARSGNWWWALAVAPIVLFSVTTLAIQIVRPPGARIARLAQNR